MSHVPVTGDEGRSDMGEVVDPSTPADPGSPSVTGSASEPDGRTLLIDELRQELEDTNRGLIALHTELEAARAGEARLAAIVASSDDAMLAVDADGLVQTWNPGARRLLGRGELEVVGRPVQHLMSQGAFDAYRSAVEQIRARQHAEPHQSRWRRADGGEVDVAVTVSAMRDAGGELIGFCTVARDITQQLAAQAELAAARADRVVTDERERIARDLHDMVIQRVFGAGLVLQSIAARDVQAGPAARITAVIDELDSTIKELRNTIFELNRPTQKAVSLRAQVLGETTAAEGRLGFAPAVEFHGPVDATVPDETAVHLLAALREALSNVGRHAGASAVQVTVRAAEDLLLEVVDNGRGIGTPTRSSGLTNLRRRAERFGGTFEVTGRAEGGTRVSWRIPVTAGGPSRTS
ncbi:PAS domain S-box protein [Streptomyces sp. NPDC002766]|uniref:PAS domain-containing sensor histidine kinase n=1 Tax=Streptomyces sp. NPDC002766 TaxID=3154429 RepID=UPI003326DC3F